MSLKYLDKRDTVFLDESNDMLEGVFLASYKEIPVTTKYQKKMFVTFKGKFLSLRDCKKLKIFNSRKDTISFKNNNPGINWRLRWRILLKIFLWSLFIRKNFFIIPDWRKIRINLDRNLWKLGDSKRSLRVTRCCDRWVSEVLYF